MGIMKREMERQSDELESELGHLCEILRSTRLLHSQVVTEYEKVLKYNDRLIRAMKHVINELEEDFDADGRQPNKAMQLASELKEAMFGPGGF